MTKYRTGETGLDASHMHFVSDRCFLRALSPPARGNHTPGMGITSPLGMTPSDSSSSSGGIPLGATELSPPGLSPLVMPCPNTASNCPVRWWRLDGILPVAAQPRRTVHPEVRRRPARTRLTSGLTAGSSDGSGIPLGATDLGTPGESQNIAVPNVSVSPCPSATSSKSGTSISPAQTGWRLQAVARPSREGSQSMRKGPSFSRLPC